MIVRYIAFSLGAILLLGKLSGDEKLALAKNSLFSSFKVYGEHVSEQNISQFIDWDITDFISLRCRIMHGLRKGKIGMTDQEHNKALLKSNHLLEKIREGDSIIFRQYDLFNFFLRELMPLIKKNVIIYYASDPTLPEDLEEGETLCKLMKEGRIVHLFGRNLNIENLPKNATQMPIGFAMHASRKLPFLTKKQRQSHLDSLFEKAPPLEERKNRIVVDIMTMHPRFPSLGLTRDEVKEVLINNDVADGMTERLTWENYMLLKGQHAFDASPPGAGIDCYRTWESLTMGCIVIVPSTFLDPLYEDLPVVKVKDWNDITPENLTKWKEEYKNRFDDPNIRKKLTNQYWVDKLLKIQDEYKMYHPDI